MLQSQLHWQSWLCMLIIRCCAFMGELFMWGFGHDFHNAEKRSFIFLSREGDGCWSTSWSKVGYWDDVLPPPCKEKLSGVNGNGNESALLHHITQLLQEGENVWEGFIYWVSVYACSTARFMHSPSSKDIYLLHGKISTQSVIRPCIFKVSYCNILGCKTVLYFGTPFATQNRQVSRLTKRSFEVLVLWTHWPTLHMMLLISLVTNQRLRCKMASGQMLCKMKS